MTHEEQLAAWNERYPVGTPVYYRPVAGCPNEVTTKTRSEAWLLGDHTAVVLIEGRTGGVAVSHCRRRSE